MKKLLLLAAGLACFAPNRLLCEKESRPALIAQLKMLKKNLKKLENKKKLTTAEKARKKNTEESIKDINKKLKM